MYFWYLCCIFITSCQCIAKQVNIFFSSMNKTLITSRRHFFVIIIIFIIMTIFTWLALANAYPRREENGNWRQVGAEARPEGPAGGSARREEIPGKDVLDDFFPLLARAPMQATRNPPMNSQPPPAPLPPVSPQMQLGVPWGRGSRRRLWEESSLLGRCCCHSSSTK